MMAAARLYVSDVYRFLYAAHLSEHGTELPAWIPAQPAAVSSSYVNSTNRP